jgi:hypothetical protein
MYRWDYSINNKLWEQVVAYFPISTIWVFNRRDENTWICTLNEVSTMIQSEMLQCWYYWKERFMKYTVEMASGIVIYKPSFSDTKELNWVGLFPLTWGWKQIQFPKLFFYFLEYRTMDEVQKPSDSERSFLDIDSFQNLLRRINIQTHREQGNLIGPLLFLLNKLSKLAGSHSYPKPWSETKLEWLLHIPKLIIELTSWNCNWIYVPGPNLNDSMMKKTVSEQ